MGPALHSVGVEQVHNAPMYPRRDVDITSTLPKVTEYWVPRPSEMGEEGYEGLYFRDVCVLSGIRIDIARGVMQFERAAAQWAGDYAADEGEFESMARAVESFDSYGDVDELHDGIHLPAELQGSDQDLRGFDLGVAGLSYVMAATGFYPVASCRSHLGRTWSAEPVVLFATDEERLRRLQPLVAQSGCGLSADATRGKVLRVVSAPSILEMMDLAQHLFDKRADFRLLPKTTRKQAGRMRSVGANPPDEHRLF